jgi:GTP-binding protein
MNYNLAKFTASYALIDQLPRSTRPEISFVGRSNVGKSSIMNKIFARKGLVKVSSRPGSTTAINFFNVGDVDFVDLPGYGFARVAPTEKDRWRELIEGYFAQDRRFALCVALVDIRHDASDLDKQMIAYLVQREIPFMIAFTKADKLSKMQIQKQVPLLCQQLSAAGDVCVVACSAEKGTGVDDLRSLIKDAVSQA